MSFVHLGSIREFPKIRVHHFGGPQNNDYGTLGFILVSRLFWETTIQRSALRSPHRLCFFFVARPGCYEGCGTAERIESSWLASSGFGL